MRTLDKLPPYLRDYCIEHDTSRYTSRDHAAWRYIMGRAAPFFSKHAVSTYVDGLKQTGISTDRIPHIDEIDQALQVFGWGAVPVCGFIPPWAFLEFQARSILPIATDMRSVDHIGYTPAPDIVHEAAGHAPILPDTEYHEYLSHYAQIGTKAIYSNQDLQLYEAVRFLSDIKEKPESTPDQIRDAELRLSAAVKECTYVSEATKVGRMSWWTAEYGLVGSSKNPKIYGAGLLSSVGESANAVTDRVKKIPLSCACTEFGFNITEPQPQLFVAEDMGHLHSVLNELEDTLSYNKGGLYAINLAEESKAVTTTTLDSGVGVSGILDQTIVEKDELVFMAYRGPVQISHAGEELANQGIDRHPQGFSSPLGRWTIAPHQAVATLSDEFLNKHHINRGEFVQIQYQSGFKLQGHLKKIHRHQDGRILYMTFTGASVTRGSELYFDPEWGEFDLVIGESVRSVHGGPADRVSYGEHELLETSSTPGRELPYTEDEKDVFEMYQDVRDLRAESNLTTVREKSAQLSSKCLEHHSNEWLIMLELAEIGQHKLGKSPEQEPWLGKLVDHLKQDRSFSRDQAELIENGFNRLEHHQIIA